MLRVDWRADYDALRYSPITVSAEVTVGMSAYLRLHHTAGLPIPAALADLLVGAQA
ncbi:MAG: hypothetical protein ACRDRW_10940 [Pseudonocardiaceae bacterium]